MTKNIKRLAAWTLVYAAVWITGFAASWTGLVSIPSIHVTLEKPPGLRSYRPSYSSVEGPELALIYIGSSRCEPSNDPNLFRSLDHIKTEIRDRAAALGLGFTTTGIAKDWIIKDGVAHLESAGPFDEIMTGRNWLNTGAFQYIWNDIPGEAATPQILIVKRRIEARTSHGFETENRSRREQLVIRKIGLSEIEAWQRLGCPLPDNESVPVKN